VYLPKISKAMDGLREAHMEVLVAVFGRYTHTVAVYREGGGYSPRRNGKTVLASSK
jgi:hypothetical protein